MTTEKISSLEDAFQYIEKYKDSRSMPEVVFSGELIEFAAEIEGKNYHSTIPGDLARGLWEFQEELYRAAAFSIYGNENIKSLTEDQRAGFQLVFQVNDGCTELLASLEEFFKKLGEGFKTMQSAHKGVTLVAIALILATGYGASTYIDNQTESKKTSTEASLEIAKEEAQTKRLQLIADLTKTNLEVNRFQKAAEEGTKSIVKGASDAEKIKFGRFTLTRDDIVGVNQRAARGNATAEIISGSFTITRADAREGGVTRFWIRDSNQKEFSATLLDEEFGEKELAAIWTAVRKRTAIILDVNTAVIRNQIRSATIIRIPVDEVVAGPTTQDSTRQ